MPRSMPVSTYANLWIFDKDDGHTVTDWLTCQVWVS